jgi:hypothetical protein
MSTSKPWAVELWLSFDAPDEVERHDDTSALCKVHVEATFREQRLGDDSPEAALQAIAGLRVAKATCDWTLRVGYGVSRPDEMHQAARKRPSKRDSALDNFEWTVGDEPLAPAMLAALEGALESGLTTADVVGEGDVTQRLEILLRKALEEADTDNLGIVEVDYVRDVLETRIGSDGANDVDNAGWAPEGRWGCEWDRLWLNELGQVLESEDTVIGELTVWGAFDYVADPMGYAEDYKAQYGADALGRIMVTYGAEDEAYGPFESEHEAKRRAREIADDEHIGEYGENAEAYDKRMEEDQEDESW